jgi:LmbE family N-acetylglucosaminyl deacetylase
MPGRWLVISPHFDDAVLSNGHLITMNPDSVVATLCGGIAPEGMSVGGWDSHHWTTARAATTGRRAEDAAALEVLLAEQICLDELDDQYRNRAGDMERSVAAIRDVLQSVEFDRVAVPLAVDKHGDHEMTRDAAIEAAHQCGITEIHLYADLPYFTGENADAVAESFGASRAREEPPTDEDLAAKRDALACYATQLELLADPPHGPKMPLIYYADAESRYLLPI